MLQTQSPRRRSQWSLQPGADCPLAYDLQRATQLVGDDHRVEVATQRQLSADLQVGVLVRSGAASLRRRQRLQHARAVGAQRLFHAPVQCQLQGIGGVEADLSFTTQAHGADACRHRQLEGLQTQLAALQRGAKRERVDEQRLRVRCQIENGIAGAQLSNRESAIQRQREWKGQRGKGRLHAVGHGLHGLRHSARQRLGGR